MKKEVKSLDEMEMFAKSFLGNISSKEGEATVVGLCGDLGSGKTTFTKALAKALGVTETLTSPTFVIEKKYAIPNHPSFDTLIHIDAYRLDGIQDLLNLDWGEIKENPRNLIIVEWPEIVGVEKTLNFKYIDEVTREISYDS